MRQLFRYVGAVAVAGVGAFFLWLAVFLMRFQSVAQDILGGDRSGEVLALQLMASVLLVIAALGVFAVSVAICLPEGDAP